MLRPESEQALAKLRVYKERGSKPLALMGTLEQIRRRCKISRSEEAALRLSSSPIVLLKRRKNKKGCKVAADCRQLGWMRPATVLHHMLVWECGPLIATSGNCRGETLCISNEEALEELGKIADAFLLHDREIIRAQDDSLIRFSGERAIHLRRGRGESPLSLPGGGVKRIAFGGDLKTTFAIGDAQQVYVSQHIGDCGSVKTLQTLENEMLALKKLTGAEVEEAVCDLHPAYRTSALAGESALPVRRVQHHLAHVMATAGEHQLEGSFLGLALDGTGYGMDGTVWGCEMIEITRRTSDSKKSFVPIPTSPSLRGLKKWVGARENFSSEKLSRIFYSQRIGTLVPFPLIGGDAASRDGRRVALALFEGAGLSRVELKHKFSSVEFRNFSMMLNKGVNSPLCSSAGRLFDGVASLLGICDHSDWEGKAAMIMEDAADEASSAVELPLSLHRGEILQIDWRPMVRELWTLYNNGVAISLLALSFHYWLTDSLLLAAEELKHQRLVLGGGCFQNALLCRLLEERCGGVDLYFPKELPPGDGGLSYGQLMAAETKN